MSRVTLSSLLDRSNRNMATGTHPVVRESALEVVRRAYAEGINVQISEGYRSNARQNHLYAQGRTRSGNIVTNARGGYSWHNYGIAVDFFLTNHTGSTAIWTVDSKWRRAAEIAIDLGFEWGGKWTSFVDYPHLQMAGGLTMAQMRAGRKPNIVSRVGSGSIRPASRPQTSTSESLVDYMNSKKMDSTYGNRAALAKKYGIDNYSGEGYQNLELLRILKGHSVPKISTGWVKNKTGWWYREADGSYPSSQWKRIDSQWYLFNKAGYMLTDWQRVNETWYYMNASGHMQTGWIKPRKSWYYMNDQGAMQTGWVELNKHWYYLDENGRMQTGWIDLGKTWFYTDQSGTMQTGWKYISNNWFYFDDNGGMRIGWYELEDQWYYFNDKGYMQSGLVEVNGKHYYLERSGALITEEAIELEANKHGELK